LRPHLLVPLDNRCWLRAAPRRHHHDRAGRVHAYAPVVDSDAQDL